MRDLWQTLRQHEQVEPYWFLIAVFLLATWALFAVHLATGYTPGREAFRIDALNLPVFWYGVLIMAGIALGAYVVSRLARERARAVFDAAVPKSLQNLPASRLRLAPEIHRQLQTRRVTTLGQLLWEWGLDHSQLGLKGDALTAVHQALQKTSGVHSEWLEDAPWRQWNPDHVWNGIIWCVVFGVIGARLYHVLTPSPSMAAVGIVSPLDYFRNPEQIFNLRSGGLGIYGGIAGGALGLFLYTRRQGIPTIAWADLAVVGLVLGQVFGRWGNFFNQELYGRPTSLPWAVMIDPEHRLPGYESVERFHPAFLYESLWSLLGFAVLFWLLRRRSDHLRTGDLTAVYLILYGIGRILLELVRLDSRTVLLGAVDLHVSVATLVSLTVAAIMVLWLAWGHWRRLD